jgi:hypothetical protein
MPESIRLYLDQIFQMHVVRVLRQTGYAEGILRWGASIPVFASVVTKLGDLFRHEPHHEDHCSHGHEHSRRGAVASPHEQYSEEAVAQSRKEHDGADGQENPHG